MTDPKPLDPEAQKRLEDAATLADHQFRNAQSIVGRAGHAGAHGNALVVALVQAIALNMAFGTSS